MNVWTSDMWGTSVLHGGGGFFVVSHKGCRTGDAKDNSFITQTDYFMACVTYVALYSPAFHRNVHIIQTNEPASTKGADNLRHGTRYLQLGFQVLSSRLTHRKPDSVSAVTVQTQINLNFFSCLQRWRNSSVLYTHQHNLQCWTCAELRLLHKHVRPPNYCSFTDNVLLLLHRLCRRSLRTQPSTVTQNH